MRDIFKIAVAIFGVFLLMRLIISATPVIWKLAGGSFLVTNDFGIEAIYKGETLAMFSKDCIVSTTKGLERVEATCGKYNVVYEYGILKN